MQLVSLLSDSGTTSSWMLLKSLNPGPLEMGTSNELVKK